MAALNIQSIGEAGLEAAYSAAGASGDTIADDGTQRTFLHVKNGSGADITVTIAAQNTSRSVPGMGAMTKSDIAVVVTAGEDRFIGPFAPQAYKDSSGLVHASYSSATTVTVAAIKVPQLAN